MKKYINLIIFSLFLLFSSCSLSSDDAYIPDENINAVRDSIVSQLQSWGFDISYQDAVHKNKSLAEQLHSIQEEEDLIFFEDMYTRFESLSDYEQYKEYIKVYPSLLPVVYALREENKNAYLQFYSFMFEQAQEQGVDMGDIKLLVGDGNDEDLKQWFLKIFGEHYDTLILEEFTFDWSFGDDPLNIAMTSDSIDIAKQNCDMSQISSQDIFSKRECYDYSYQYRATSKNNFCEKVSDEYQKRICKWYLDYISR